MSFRWMYVIGLLLCFGAGAYVWRVTHSGDYRKPSHLTAKDRPRGNTPGVLVYVGEQRINSEDLDFEYSLMTNGVFDAEDLTPIPDLGSRFEKELSPLMTNLMAEMVERKMLMEFIRQDDGFDIETPARKHLCLTEWEKAKVDSKAVLPREEDAERLKERLCETSMISQYLRERVLTHAKVSDTEVKEYYQTHEKEFETPPRVVIRQILLATEKEAKIAQSGLFRSNFAQRAKELSIAPEGQNGGRLGPFAKGEMPGVFDIAFEMRVGDIYGILKSTYGFHLILLEQKIPKQKQTLEQVAARIHKSLMGKKEEEQYQNWIDTALNSVSIRSPKVF